MLICTPNQNWRSPFKTIYMCPSNSTFRYYCNTHSPCFGHAAPSRSVALQPRMLASCTSCAAFNRLSSTSLRTISPPCYISYHHRHRYHQLSSPWNHLSMNSESPACNTRASVISICTIYLNLLFLLTCTLTVSCCFRTI